MEFINQSSEKINKIFVLLLVTVCILQIHNLLSFPTSRGFDALNHRDYISFIKTEKRIPLPSEGWELYQPPLYYLIASIFPNTTQVKLIGFITWIILTIFSYYFYKKVFKDSSLAYLGAVIITSLPVVLYLTPTISNEFFSGVMISLTLIYYLLNINNLKQNSKIFLGILIGLSLLAKATAFVLLLSICLSEFWPQRKKLINALKLLILPLSVAILISGWFYGRNLILYKNPFISSVDFPRFQDRQKPTGRNLKFFTDLTGFSKMDLYKSHHYSLLPGTYFSWFYDGHNVLLPVQEYSKKGILLMVFTIPIFFISVFGYFKEIKNISVNNLLFIIYPLFLFISYILYNLKIPLYSTVKGSFLVSLVVPFGYFFLRGIEEYKSKMPFILSYLILYLCIFIFNFEIKHTWYKQ